MPDIIDMVARLLLCTVFTVAAWTKLIDRQGTREAIVAFGAPERAAAPLALLIPVAELAAAALLLPAATAVAGSLVALGLLLVFSVAIAVNLARGRAPECHCFGQLHSAPAGPRTLARNFALAAAAVLVLVDGDNLSAVAWIGRLHDAGLVAFVAAIVGCAALVAGTLAFVSLLRSYGRVLVRVDRLERALHEAGIGVDDDVALEVVPPQHGLAPRTTAPGFAALGDLLAPRLPLLLLFASPSCGPCSALLPEVARWQREHADRLTVAVANDGTPEHVHAEAQELGLERMLIDDGGELYRAFEANGTPGAVLINPDGRIASRVASGRDAIEALVRGVLDAPGVPVGAVSPSIELEALDGTLMELGRPSERDSLILFWNPDCGFCRGMHEDLVVWEQSINGHGPRLVVVSSGDAERTRADGFSSTVVLDPGFSAGEAFGAGGTPSAVLVGADGRVASNVAVGAQAVLALTGNGMEVAAR
jgi:thiol-disulfide isomerase/thioredoxin